MKELGPSGVCLQVGHAAGRLPPSNPDLGGGEGKADAEDEPRRRPAAAADAGKLGGEDLKGWWAVIGTGR